ncbi:coenzyme F420 hydrogenase/dehydrogenase beta subunit N-terminal domain-containing protein [Candidatus Margulisiibacteriota bacterium]
MPKNACLGNYVDTFAVETNDKKIHKIAQSGGFVSTMLIYLLDRKIIDGTVVTRWRKDDPFLPETYIARNKKEVLEAVGSKYIPVPTNVIIKNLLKEKGKFAFVGTSCQIHGMRKTEELFPNLKKIELNYI